jgi:hypothetical protein
MTTQIGNVVNGGIMSPDQCAAVIASEAKQSRLAKQDWIASSLALLAMTGE